MSGVVKVIGRFTLLFKAVKVLVVKDTVLLVLVHDYLGKVLNIEGSSWGQDDVPWEVGVLQRPVHGIDLLAIKSWPLENDGITYTLHAVLYQVLVVIKVFACVKVLC